MKQQKRFSTLITIRNIDNNGAPILTDNKHQISTLELFLKDHVTLKTGVMTATEISFNITGINYISQYIQIENVSVTYVTLVPWRRERRRHVGWPTKLGSRQRDQSTSSVTKRANGHWHAIIASSCRWSPCEYKRQQVHRINSCFRWGAEPETRQLSGGTATVATGRDVSVPSFRERGLHT